MKQSPIIWLLKKIKCRIPAIAVMTVAQLCNTLLSVMFALTTRDVVDAAVSGQRQMFFAACIKQGLIILGILISLTIVRHLRERLTADLDRDWKRQLLHGLLHGEYSAVSSYHSAELLNRMNNDVSKVNDGILSIIPGATAMSVRLVASIVVLCSLDARLTGLVALLGCLMILVTGFLRYWLKNINKRVSEQDGYVSGFLQEIMEKLLMVQAMDATTEVERRADVVMEERYQVQRMRKNISLFANTCISIAFYGVGFLSLIWCASQMLRGRMSFGSLTAITQLVGQLQAPFVNLSGVMPKYVAMVASAERLMELDEIQEEATPLAETSEQLYRWMDSIKAEKLCFSYDRDYIFKNAEFSLPKGAFVVVTGSSGIGKSTLLKLLLGVFRQNDGELYIHGEHGDYPIDRSTRRLFAYVPQGNLLLSGTLRENLTIVKPEATEEEIQNALYISAMEEYLPQLPLGLDTVIGESGTGLSEGQAQRLAIARAILGGAPILLLDECTSALDSATEETVLTRLRSLPGHTCIAVTHRPATVAIGDWQLSVADGKINMVKI